MGISNLGELQAANKEKSIPAGRKGARLASKILAAFSIVIVFILGTVVSSLVMSAMMNHKVNLVKSQDMRLNEDVEAANIEFMTDDDNMLYLTGIPASTDGKTVQSVVDAMSGAEADLLSSLQDMQESEAALTPSERKDVQAAMQASKAYLSFVHQVEQQNRLSHRSANHTVFQTADETSVLQPLLNS